MRFSVLLLLAGPLVLAQLNSMVVYAASVSSVSSFTTTIRAASSSSPRSNSVSSVRPFTITIQAASSSAQANPAVASASSLRTLTTHISLSTWPSTSVGLAPSSASTPIAGNAPNAGSGICGGSSNGCWPGGYSIENDTETTWPNTGRTVEYELTITNTTCTAAGYEKPCILINNQFPGPTIQANWGDTVRVVVTNQLQDNGTSMHWHGIRQFQTNNQDGVNGITECPIPPGQSKTYEWQATSYGTSWYHSHYAAQYGDGVLGPLVINGPTTAGYDIDMGPIAISETYRLQQAPMGGATTVDEIITNQGPLIDVPDNILFNGKNVNAEGGGEHLQMTMEPGKKHLMRFINVGVDNFYKVGLDDHMMQVVAIDLQPVQPYYTQYVSLGIGQRFDAIVTANQTVGNYYLRALPMSCVDNKNNGTGTQNAIISYRGAKAALPTSTAAPVIDNCFDEPAEKTIPFVAKSVNISTFDPHHLPIASPTQVTEGNNRVFRWQLGNTSQSANWESPLLQRLVQGNSTIMPADNVVFINEPTTAFWYIQNNFYEPHPIHLHGNDVRILASGDGQWDEDVSKLEVTNPMRRDTFMVRAGGYILLALETNNPGVWLMHCHIAWHVSEGLSTALYVRKNDIKFPVAVTKAINDGCTAWNEYRAINGTVYQRTGSGL